MELNLTVTLCVHIGTHCTYTKVTQRPFCTGRSTALSHYVCTLDDYILSCCSFQVPITVQYENMKHYVNMKGQLYQLQIWSQYSHKEGSQLLTVRNVH